jgi:lipopolysaccharide/colanic/teichoic acid biosynthesis glycosyltransferase
MKNQYFNTVTRFLDLFFSGLGILFFFPIGLVLAAWIKLDSKGPVFYRQLRVGKNGKDFLLYKFRSMSPDSDQKGLLTIGGKDQRITHAGYYLRKYKIDEIPQLINVFTGEMSMVGPRPEVRKYVQLYTEEQRQVLTVKPGITDMASITYENENEILSRSKDPEATYIHSILPHKIELNMLYINDPSIHNYFMITMKTISKILSR